VLKARLPRPLLRRTGLAERLLALATIRGGRLTATCSVACSQPRAGGPGRLFRARPWLAALPFLLGCGRHHLPAAVEPSSRLLPTERAFIDAAPGEPFPMVTTATEQGERALRQQAWAVDPSDPGLADLEARMRATLDHEQGVGLAAPQVGLSRRAILVQRLDRPDDPVEFYLNPALTWVSETTVLGWEGCLSIPDGFGQVERAEAIRVAYDLPGGEQLEECVSGWTARIFMHEIDHLDGLLFTDHSITHPLLPEAEYRELRRLEPEAEQPDTSDTGAP